MVYCICDKETNIIMDIVSDIKPIDDEPGQFHDLQNDIVYSEDVTVYYGFDDIPKYVRIGDWKYEPNKGFNKAWDYQESRELRIGQMDRYKAMTDAMKQYDSIKQNLDKLNTSNLSSDEKITVIEQAICDLYEYILSLQVG